MRRTLLALLVVVTPAALLAACGDDDDGGDGADDTTQAHIEAWVTNLTEDEDGLQVTDDDAECMAEALVERLGVEPFEEAGVTTEEIATGASPGELLGTGTVAEDDARAVLAEWTDCTNLGELLADSMAQTLGLDEDGTSCLREALADERLAVELLVTSFTNETGEPDEGAFAEFSGILDECGAGSQDG